MSDRTGRRRAPAPDVCRVASVVVSLGVAVAASAGCGHGRESARAPRSASAGAAGAKAAVSGPHSFGDYDADEFVSHPGRGDMDNDDDKEPRDRDNDLDNKAGSYFDVDDDISLKYGYPADVADRRAITGLVERYYALAAAHDGRGACSLLSAPAAGSVPQTLGVLPYFRGRTCAEVMTKVFQAASSQFAAYAASMRIASVGVYRGEGVVVFAVKGRPGRGTRVLREHVWKMDAPVDFELV